MTSRLIVGIDGSEACPGPGHRRVGHPRRAGDRRDDHALTGASPLFRLIRLLDLHIEQFTKLVERDITASLPAPRPVVWRQLHRPDWHLYAAIEEGAARVGCSVVDVTLADLHRIAEPHGSTLTGERPEVIFATASDESTLVEVALTCALPLINAGTDLDDPLAVLADLITVKDELGLLRDRTVVIATKDVAAQNSWVDGAALAGMHLHVVNPDLESIPPRWHEALQLAELFGGSIQLHPVSRSIVAEADVIISDSRSGSDDSAIGAFVGAARSDAVLLPTRLRAADAEAGHAPDEGSRTLLYHRTDNLRRAVASLIRMGANEPPAMADVALARG